MLLCDYQMLQVPQTIDYIIKVFILTLFFVKFDSDSIFKLNLVRVGIKEIASSI